MTGYTNDVIIEKLREFKVKFGRNPASDDFRYGSPYASTIIYRFGSWQQALLAAGLIENVRLFKRYTVGELINELRQFKMKFGRNPTSQDFKFAQPGADTFCNRFRSWQAALLAAELIEKIDMATTTAKGRKGELLVLNSYKSQGAIDLSGTNYGSPVDHICPKGFACDVKTSRYDENLNRWQFGFTNKSKDKIEILQLIAYGKSFTNVLHVWQVPSKSELITCRTSITITNSKNALERWRKYEISTDQCVVPETPQLLRSTFD